MSPLPRVCHLLTYSPILSLSLCFCLFLFLYLYLFLSLCYSPRSYPLALTFPTSLQEARFLGNKMQRSEDHLSTSPCHDTFCCLLGEGEGKTQERKQISLSLSHSTSILTCLSSAGLLALGLLFWSSRKVLVDRLSKSPYLHSILKGESVHPPLPPPPCLSPGREHRGPTPGDGGEGGQVLGLELRGLPRGRRGVLSP